MKRFLLKFFLAVFSCALVFCVNSEDRVLKKTTPAIKSGSHYIVNLKNALNSSIFDDGIANNGKGGWTDEGTNDFYIFPAIKFGKNKYRAYLFDFLDPKKNNGKNLLLIGHDKVWENLPESVELKNINAKGKYVFMMHSEGRILDKKKKGTAAVFTVKYSDGTTRKDELRMGKELSDWYQGKWWNCYEEARKNAPDALKKSECNPEKYKKLGGTNFKEDVLKHAVAKRWPVTQGYNSVSRTWSLPVVFWAYKFENPFPRKEIKSIKIDSTEDCLIGISAITISNEDFSLKRQAESGKMRKPSSSPSDYFAKREEKMADSIVPELISKKWTKGIRKVQQRSDKILTVKVDHIAKLSELKNPKCFLISSRDDADFKNGVNPVSISRFSRGGRYRAIADDQYKVYPDHWLHLKLPHKLKKGKHYKLELIGDIFPESDKLKDEISFKTEDLRNPGFKLNQVGYSNNSNHKYIYLSSYLGDGKPVNIDEFRKFRILDDNTGKTVFTGDIVKVSDSDIQGKDKLYKLDISEFDKNGKFYVEADGLGRSYSFINGDEAAEKIYDIAHRGLFFQRCGTEIKEPYAEGWTRPMAHNKIYVTETNLPHPSHTEGVDPNKPGKWQAEELEFHGGHYDAGDYDLRPMHINVPEKLLTLYEAFPEKFYDGQVNIPEKNNGIPDIIDEAAWNLKSLEYIQDYASEIRGLEGGVAPGMETYRHPVQGEGMGKDPLPYYMRKVTGPFSLCAAAEFAHIARIIKPFDKKRAAKYLKRAEKAYKYGYKHLNDPQPKMVNGKVDQGEGWNRKGINSALIWANVELYCTTGQKKYWKQIVKLKNKRRGTIAGSINSGDVIFSLLLSKLKHPKNDFIEKWRRKWIKYAEKHLDKVDKNAENGYAASTPNGGGWGSTSCVVKNMEGATRAYMLTEDQKFLDRIATSIDFTLGMNPSEMSWMTGAGKVYPMDPLNLNCIDDDMEEPSPGILWYGPTNYWGSEKVLLYPNKKNMGFYRRVVDAWGMVAQCEYTVWETQAPFIFAAGCLLPNKNNH